MISLRNNSKMQIQRPGPKPVSRWSKPGFSPGLTGFGRVCPALTGYNFEQQRPRHGRILTMSPECGRPRPQQAAHIRARWKIPVRLDFGRCCARDGRTPAIAGSASFRSETSLDLASVSQLNLWSDVQPMITPDSFQLLRAKTLARLQEIAASTRGVIGLFVLDPASGDTFAVNEHVPFPQASAIKIPVLMEVYKQAGEGKFKLSDENCITREEKAVGGGILSHLGDGTVRMSIHDLCVLMIMVSDNTATNILIDLVGIENVNRTLESLGLRHTRLRRLFRLSQSTGHGTYIAPAERKATG
jgi:hypothetical protein